MSSNLPPLSSPLELAKFFHETYERLAQKFGYETRAETRTFDLKSANAALMVTVCDEVMGAVRAYGEACAAAAVAAESDCRTCANFTTKSGGCVSVVQCLDADCFKPTAPRRYWSIRARGET